MNHRQNRQRKSHRHSLVQYSACSSVLKEVFNKYKKSLENSRFHSVGKHNVAQIQHVQRLQHVFQRSAILFLLKSRSSTCANIITLTRARPFHCNKKKDCSNFPVQLMFLSVCSIDSKFGIRLGP